MAAMTVLEHYYLVLWWVASYLAVMLVVQMVHYLV